MPYLSALEMCSRQGAIQIHVYLTLPWGLNNGSQFPCVLECVITILEVNSSILKNVENSLKVTQCWESSFEVVEYMKQCMQNILNFREPVWSYQSLLT